MNARSLDTYRIVKRLRGVGFSDEQAETVTDLMREVREFDLSDLATKADVEKLAAEIETVRLGLTTEIETVRLGLTADNDKLRVTLTSDIEVLRQEMRSNRSDLMAEIAGSHATMLKWFIGLLLAQGGVVVTLLKLIPGH